MRKATAVPGDTSQPHSRVHELGRMSRIDLIAIYLGLCDPAEARASRAAAAWSRDQLIAAIRNREDDHDQTR